jgi:4-aminobutyrate aminotransferase-like enzyme/Ser/Thr protein kinase RdoA (MazF antagonist)
MLDATIRRPTLTLADAARIAEQHFGIAGNVTDLLGERDRNFKVATETGKAFVLKVSQEAEDISQLECENAALAWIADRAPSLPIASILNASDGNTIVRVAGSDGTEHFARVMTHLPGKVLAKAAPHSASLLDNLGAGLGTLDGALADFEHEATKREFLWDLARARVVIERHRASVTEPERQATIDHVIRLWDRAVEPALGELRRSVIYNDSNDYNILVNADPSKAREVSGFVDFGDMVESYTICELAIAMAYVMLGKRKPLAAASAVTAGYHRSHPITDREVDLLFPLACARLAVSVCVSAARSAENPNDDYLRVSEDPAWRTLERLTTIDPQFARAFLRVRTGEFTALPTVRPLSRWLRVHREEFAAVVDPDPRSALTTILDLSVGSTLLPDPVAMAGTNDLSDVLFGEMTRVGAAIGIGRYNEPRLWYTSDGFAGADGDRRTIHIAVDLFVPAGTFVRAPLDGVVESVQENAGLLDYGPTVILRHEPPDGPPFYTLYGHLSRSVLTQLARRDNVSAGKTFAELGTFQENGNWPPHLHFQIISDLLGTVGNFPGVVPADERDVWTALCPDPNLILGLEKDVQYESGVRERTLLDQRRALVGPSLNLSYARPLQIVRGRGVTLYDVEGREYLDCVNNVCHVGHCHPKVVQAIQRQAGVLNTNTRYLHENIVRYAEQLTARLPSDLTVCFFVNSGSEANDLALRIARTVTGRPGVIVIDGAYHGHTQSLIDASPYKFAGPGGAGQQPYVYTIPMPDPYRGSHPGADSAEEYAAYVTRAVHAMRVAGQEPAAFIAESLLGCGGQIEPPPDYLRHAFDNAREAGALCIADEVQVGFGRMGSHFWGFETQRATPDIVTMGKPIGNGHPLGAVVTTRAVADAFANGMEYFNTFGGNPVSCAAGLAVLEVIREEHLQRNAHTVGGDLKLVLSELAEKHAIIGEVRGRGLFLGIELVRDRDTRTPATMQARYIIERLRAERILLSRDGADNNVLKFKPPMVFDARDADRLVTALDRILGEDFITASVGR